MYWTIKDKVVEEAYNGLRSIKKSAKVKVYGTDMTKDVRARMIEILFERVRYHKDKFICPWIHKEMSSMTVKPNGKIEHVDKAHDDQVFSYLHALYVWYDGENLADRWHIQKNILKTDADEELLESQLEEEINESVERITPEQLEIDENPEVEEAYKFIEENNNFMDSRMFMNKERDRQMTTREILLNNDKKARAAYSKMTGMDESNYGGMGNNMYVSLPDHIFNDTDSLLGPGDDNEMQIHTVLSGNLSKMWNHL